MGYGRRMGHGRRMRLLYYYSIIDTVEGAFVTRLFLFNVDACGVHASAAFEVLLISHTLRPF